MHAAAFNASDIPYTLIAERALTSALNTTKLLTPGQAQSIQIVSCILSGTSLFAALITFVWFLRMTRKFRHNLIFILISADVSRSFWLLIFCLVSLIAGQPTTNSNFCQVTGYFYQSSITIADLTVLTIAVHTALQIFRPHIGHVGGRGDESGLYRFRFWIYAVIAILPFVVASLAFVNGAPGFRSQGPYCSLPVRPFWFRLGLSWIPRYCILLTILGLYIAIYIHVAVQFRTISWLRKLPGGPKIPAPDHDIHNNHDGSFDPKSSRPLHTLNLFSIRQNSQVSTFAGSFGFPRRFSRVSSSGTVSGTASGTATLIGSTASGAIGGGEGRGGSVVEKAPEVEPHGLATFAPVREVSMLNESNYDGNTEFITSAISPPDTPMNNPPKTAQTEVTATQDEKIQAAQLGLEQLQTKREMRKRHAAVQHKVRTLFIYPIVYFIMWTLPFVSHAFSYSNYWAQNPIYWLVLTNFLCISTMGAADSLVFSLREKPWRSIPSSDGSFWGSFMFWRRNAGRRPSAESGESTSDSSQTMAYDLTDMQRLSRLDSIAEGDVEHDAANHDPSSRGTDPPSWQAGRQHGLHSYDFAAQDGTRSNSSARRTQDHQERHWFDRRLSLAIGRSVQPNVLAQ